MSGIEAPHQPQHFAADRGTYDSWRPLSLEIDVPERSSPSRVRFAAQNPRALDSSGPFRKPHLYKGKGAAANAALQIRTCNGLTHLKNSCRVCWRTTKMAHRSLRRIHNLISVEVFLDRTAYRDECGRIPSWPG